MHKIIYMTFYVLGIQEGVRTLQIVHEFWLFSSKWNFHITEDLVDINYLFLLFCL